MIGFTKERIKQFIKSPLEHGLTRSEQMEMARQLLAGMEQEPVAQVYQPANIGICAPLGPSVMMLKPLIPGTKLYAAPQLPQPAGLSVPEGVLKSLLPDAEKSEFWFEHDGKIFFEGVKFNNAVFEACRAAMLQGAEPVQPYTLRDGWVAVPVEPTKEMVSAGQDEMDNCIENGFDSDIDGNRFDYTDISPDAPYRIYLAMIAAAPQQEVKP